MNPPRLIVGLGNYGAEYEATRHNAGYWLVDAIARRERARFSAWYEFFPRNAEGRDDKHSTFRDCIERLDDAKEMGFDVIASTPEAYGKLIRDEIERWSRVVKEQNIKVD